MHSVELRTLSPAELSRTARVHIAGHRGLVGSALVRHFTEQGFGDLLLRSSDVTDLRERDAVRRLYAAERPRVVVLAATGSAASPRTPRAPSTSSPTTSASSSTSWTRPTSSA